MQTPIPGTNLDFSMDVATVLTAIEGFHRDLKLTFGAKTVDIATLGDAWEAPFATLRNAQIAGGGIRTTTVDGYFFAAHGFNTSSFQIRPDGAGTGKVEYTGEMVVTAYDPFAATVDGVDMFTFTANVVGAVTRALQA